MGFFAAKGDVSGAFLQGRDLQRDLWVPAAPELAAALNVSPGEMMMLKKAAYFNSTEGTRMAPFAI